MVVGPVDEAHAATDQQSDSGTSACTAESGGTAGQQGGHAAESAEAEEEVGRMPLSGRGGERTAAAAGPAGDEEEEGEEWHEAREEAEEEEGEEEEGKAGVKAGGPAVAAPTVAVAAPDRGAGGEAAGEEEEEGKAGVHAGETAVAASAVAPPFPDSGARGEEAEEEEEAGAEAGEVAAAAPDPEAEARMLACADALKLEGNRLYGEGRLAEAAEKYNEAIHAAPEGHPAGAVYYANLAACELRVEGRATEAARACSEAIALDPKYSKAYMRRSTALEKLDDLDHALTDAKQVLELEPDSAWAKAAVKRLEPLVAERHEKLKDEMMGKLKDLGNTILGKFGMSLDNFKAEKDPNTGGYSIKFQQ